MKTLMKKGGIGLIVARLDGYLQAVRDMNDDHSATRYWFWADMLSVKNDNIPNIIHRYLKKLRIKIESDIVIKEIDLEEELTIIEAHILKNYLQGTADLSNEKQLYVMHLHGWRIQEYISLAANYEKAKGRWMAKVVSEEGELTSIFVQIKNELIVMNFLIR